MISESVVILPRIAFVYFSSHFFHCANFAGRQLPCSTLRRRGSDQSRRRRRAPRESMYAPFLITTTRGAGGVRARAYVCLAGMLFPFKRTNVSECAWLLANMFLYTPCLVHAQTTRHTRMAQGNRSQSESESESDAEGHAARVSRVIEQEELGESDVTSLLRSCL